MFQEREMSSFQFGFNFDNNENNDTTTINSDSHHKYDHTRERRSTSSMHVVHMQEIITAHLPSLNNLAQWKHDVIQIGPNDSLKRIHPSEKPFSQSYSQHRLDETSDLISGVYEGGLKVWECSIDLCHYLSEHVLSHDVINPISSLHRGGSILELGCGRKSNQILYQCAICFEYTSYTDLSPLQYHVSQHHSNPIYFHLYSYKMVYRHVWF